MCTNKHLLLSDAFHFELNSRICQLESKNIFNFDPDLLGQYLVSPRFVSKIYLFFFFSFPALRIRLFRIFVGIRIMIFLYFFWI